MKMSPLDMVIWILIIIGGLNWGLVGFFDFNIVTTIFGEGSTMSNVVYDIVGLAALWSLARMFMMVGGKKPAAPAQPTM